MIVFPLRRTVGLKAATASSRVETLPMFVRRRPSRTRWTISLSWARKPLLYWSEPRPPAYAHCSPPCPECDRNDHFHPLGECHQEGAEPFACGSVHKAPVLIEEPSRLAPVELRAGEHECPCCR